MGWFSRKPKHGEPAPAFSIIVCSHRPEHARAIREHYAALFRDEPHEVIVIPDARSLCEGYTRGLAQSLGERLVFSHDDVEFVTPDVARRLKLHLGTWDLVGVAGTTRLINGVWTAAGDPHVFGLVIYPDGEGWYKVSVAGKGPLCVDGVQALDGCFFACRREVAETIGFDAATFDGFHYYDLDFTFAAHLHGYRLAVCRDLALIHASQGNPDPSWNTFRRRFEAKYQGRLATGVEAPSQTLGARVPRAALAGLCAPDQMVKALSWT